MPCRGNTFAKRGVAHKQQARLAILHHGGKLTGGLPRIERHDDSALGHQRQVKHDPANRIGCEESAAIAELNAGMPQECPHPLNLLEQFSPGHAHKLLAMDFPKNDAVVRTF